MEKDKLKKKRDLQIEEIGETEYAFQLGKQVASLTNEGLLCKTFCYNQYFGCPDKNDELYINLKEKVKSNDIRNKDIVEELQKLEDAYPIIYEYNNVLEKLRNLEGRVEDTETQKRVEDRKKEFKNQLKNIRNIDKQNGDNISRYENLRDEQKRMYFDERYQVSKILKQVLFVGSSISDLQDKMRNEGKSIEEINQVLENYVQGFCSSINFKQISETFGYEQKYIKMELASILNSGEEKYSEKLAGYSERDAKIYDEPTYNANKKYDSFYERLSNAIIKQLEQQMNKEQAPESNKNDEMNVNCDYSRN